MTLNPSMPQRSVESRVFNLSFGCLLTNPIRFSWQCEELGEMLRRKVQFWGELLNDSKSFDLENQFAAFHSFNNKQNLGHNFRAAAETGRLRIKYDDFPADYTYAVVERANLFLSEVVAPILSFFQRRRILFSTARFTSSERLVYAMPMFMAAEWIDSVSFGPQAIDPQDTEAALTSALLAYEALCMESKGRIRMLLHRYNELLNLPYVHERVEGLWRIIEALGDAVPTTAQAEAEYNRLRPICGVQQQSRNLRRAVSALVHYGIAYDDAEIKESFEIRNLSMHEYLNPTLLSSPMPPNSFRFLYRSVDRAIAKDLGLSNFDLKEAAFMIMINRVL